MIPDRASCYCLWDTYAVPEKKRIHLELVARVAEFFAMKLKSIYPTINTSLLVAAALLHDIDKSVEKLPDENHPDAAVRILKKEGMEEVAVLVKTHPLHAILDENISPKTIEEKLLFLADKMVKYEVITVDERFSLWRQEILPEEGRKQLEKAYPLVKQLEKEICTKIGIMPQDLAKYVHKAYTITT